MKKLIRKILDWIFGKNNESKGSTEVAEDRPSGGPRINESGDA